MADETLERITILLQAKDRDFQRAMDRNNKVIARLSRDAVRNTSKMADGIDSRLSQLQSSVSSFGVNFVRGLGVGIVSTALAGISTNIAGTIKQVAAIGDEAKRAGLSAKAFQEWKFVAEQNRIGVDQLVDGFKELALRADEFIVTGAGPAAEAFRRIGLEGAALKGKLEDPSALMLEIISRMQDLDTAGQIRVADELFGGSAGERFVELIGQGESGLRATITAAHEAGAVLDAEMIQKAAELDRQFGEISASVATAFQKAIVYAAEFFNFIDTEEDKRRKEQFQVDRREDNRQTAAPLLGSDTADALANDVEALKEAADYTAALAAEVEFLTAVGSETTLVLADLSTMLRGLGQGDAAAQMSALSVEVSNAVAMFQEGKLTGDELRAVLESVAVQAGSASDVLAGIDGIGFAGVIARLGGLIGRIRETAREAAAAAFNVALVAGTAPAPVDTSLGRRAQDAADRARENPTYAPSSSPRPRRAPNDIDFGLPAAPSAGSGSGGGGSGGGGLDAFARAAEGARDRIAQWEAEAAALTATIAAGGEYGNVLDYARKKAELLQAAQEAGKEMTPELTAEIDKLAMAYATAGQNAEDAAEKLKQIEDASKRGADAITNVFSGVLSGAKSAREAVADLLMQLAQVQLQRAIFGMAQSGGPLGALFGGLGSALMPARAGGGPVRAGVPHLVNENTPNSEVFVPSRSGGVLNVAQAKDALRGGGAQQVVLRVELTDDLNARMVSTAQGVSIETVRAYSRGGGAQADAARWAKDQHRRG